MVQSHFLVTAWALLWLSRLLVVSRSWHTLRRRPFSFPFAERRIGLGKEAIKPALPRIYPVDAAFVQLADRPARLRMAHAA